MARTARPTIDTSTTASRWPWLASWVSTQKTRTSATAIAPHFMTLAAIRLIGSPGIVRGGSGGATSRYAGWPPTGVGGHPRRHQPLARLATISFWAASKRAFGWALPAMTSAAAWPSGPQTEFMAGMFGMAWPPLPASNHALTSGLEAETSL